MLVEVSESIGGERRPFLYWILVSPFPLHHARLPKLGPPGTSLPLKDPRAQAFFKWARDERELECVTFTPPATAWDGTAFVRDVWTPWHWGQALHAEAGGLLARYHHRMMDPHRAALRTLLATVQAIGKQRNLADYIDWTAFEATKEDLKRDAHLYDRVNTAFGVLTTYLESPRFKAVLLDMWAEDGDEAKARLIPILDQLHDGQLEMKAGREYLVRFYADNKSLYFVALELLKTERRVLKAYWSFVKAGVAMATVKERAERFAPFIKVCAKKFAGVDLVLEQFAPGKFRFTYDSVRKLQERTTRNPSLTNLFVLVDVFNVVVVAHELATGQQDWRGWVALGSAMTSILSSLGSAAEAQGVTSARALRAARLLGVVSGTLDVLTSAMDAWHEYDTGGVESAIAPGLRAIGGLASALGTALQVMAPASIVAPWLLIAGGAIAGALVILAPILESDQLEDWLRHCYWGKNRSFGADATESWSEGPLGSFHGDPQKQLRALNTILFEFKIDGEFAPAGAMFEVRTTHRALQLESKLYLEVLAFSGGHWKTIRPSKEEWKPREPSPGRRFSSVDIGDAESVIVRVAVDIFGDGQVFYPAKPDREGEPHGWRSRRFSR